LRNSLDKKKKERTGRGLKKRERRSPMTPLLGKRKGEKGGTRQKKGGKEER